MMERKNGTNISPQERYKVFWEEFNKISHDEYFDKWQPEMRKGYLEQGAEFVVDVHERKVGVIVFLDKSARPLALFFLALWKRIFPDENPPEMRFMLGEKGKYIFTEEMRDDIKKIQGKTREEVDTMFEADEVQRVEKIKQTYRASDFENQVVLVVDEYGNEGYTLTAAQNRLIGAFPAIKQVLVGAIDWQYDSTYKTPISLDIAPPSDSPNNPCFFSSRQKKLGRNIFRQVDYVEEPNFRLSDAPVIVSQKSGVKTKPTETISHHLFQIGQFEQLDQKSMKAVDEAKQYCTKRNDEEGLERVQKIKNAYLSLTL